MHTYKIVVAAPLIIHAKANSEEEAKSESLKLLDDFLSDAVKIYAWIEYLGTQPLIID